MCIVVVNVKGILREVGMGSGNITGPPSAEREIGTPRTVGEATLFKF